MSDSELSGIEYNDDVQNNYFQNSLYSNEISEELLRLEQ